MLIMSKHRLKRQASLLIRFDSQLIDNVLCQKIIGIHVENSLQLKVHIQHVCIFFR